MKSRKFQRPSDDEAIEATAAAWLAERDDGFAPAREADFDAWHAADPRHEAAVVRLAAAWGALQQLHDFRPEARMHPDSDLLRRGSRSTRIATFPAIAAAALAACVVIAAVWSWSRTPRDVEARGLRYATTPDGYQRVALDDGSVLELNANTAVDVRFTREERRIRLERGEAHFTVAKNKARPFNVEAGGIAVHAIGTAFNVRLGTSEIEVLVTEGKVQVAPPGRAVPSRDERDARELTTANIGATFLGANERALIARTSAAPDSAAAVVVPMIEKVAPDVVRQALAWQGPRLVFADTPLSQVIAQFNRRNHVQLVIADPELEALPIGGSFRPENLDAFVRLLAAGNEIAVEYVDAQRIVLRRAAAGARPN